jgi:hypothetical protein
MKPFKSSNNLLIFVYNLFLFSLYLINLSIIWINQLEKQFNHLEYLSQIRKVQIKIGKNYKLGQ